MTCNHLDSLCYSNKLILEIVDKGLEDKLFVYKSNLTDSLNRIAVSNLSINVDFYDNKGKIIEYGFLYLGKRDNTKNGILLELKDASGKEIKQPLSIYKGRLEIESTLIIEDLFYSATVVDSKGGIISFFPTIIKNVWDYDVIEQINTAIIDSADAARQVAIDITNDAINNTAVEGGVLADTFLTATSKFTNDVARTQRAKNSDIVSVKDFGAKGDGVSNDTLSIKQAMQYCSREKKTLYFPSGVYKYISSEALLLTNGINIDGNNATLVGNGSSEFLAYSDNINLKNLIFKDFFRVIYGATTLERTTYKSMRVEGCTFFRCLRTIEVSAARGTAGATSAADISSLTELVIRNNIIDSCGNGIRIWRHILSGFVVNNRVTNIGNIIEDTVITTARGIDIGWDDLGYVPELHDIGSITATGNYISKIYSVGTKSRSMHAMLIMSPNTVLSGNEVFGVYGKEGETTHGLYVKGANVLITNNIVRDAGDEGFAVTIKPTYDAANEVPKSEVKAIFTDNFIEFSPSYTTKARHGGIRSTGDNPTIISSNYIRGAVGSAITGSKNNTSITNNTIIDFKGSPNPTGYSSVVSLLSLTGTITGNTITAYDRVGELVLFDISVLSTEASYNDEALLTLNISNNTLKLKEVEGISDTGTVHFIAKLVSIASANSLGVFSITNNQVTFPTGSVKKFRFLRQYNNNNQGTENLIIAGNMTNLPPDNLILSVFPAPINRLEEHSNIQCGILSLGNPRIGNSSSYPSKVSSGYMYFDAEKDGLMIRNESGTWVDVKGRTVAQLRGLPVGTASERPTAAYLGKTFYDKTNKVMFIFDGSNWVTVAGVNTSFVKRKGTTSERPLQKDVYAGFVYFDTELGTPIFSDGIKWVNTAGDTV